MSAKADYDRRWRQGNPDYARRWHADRPNYTRWRDMKRRCLNLRNPDYPRYGGRGITIFAEWIDSYDAFAAWLDENLGPCPAGMSLDRIDNDGNYEPGNLRWTTAREQQRQNRS